MAGKQVKILSCHSKGWLIGLYSLGGVAAIIVIFNSFSAVGWFGSQWWDEWGIWIISALLIIGVIVTIAVSGDSKKSTTGTGTTVADSILETLRRKE